MADLPRDKLMAHAQRAIDTYEEMGIPTEVQFKGTCPACGSRCSFIDRNVCHERMECARCGVTFPFLQGGYRLFLLIKKGGGPRVG